MERLRPRLLRGAHPLLRPKGIQESDFLPVRRVVPASLVSLESPLPCQLP